MELEAVAPIRRQGIAPSTAARLIDTIEIKADHLRHRLRKPPAPDEIGRIVDETAARPSHSDAKSSAPCIAGVYRARRGQSGFDRVRQTRKAEGGCRPEDRVTAFEDVAVTAAACAGGWHPQGESNPCFHRERVAS